MKKELSVKLTQQEVDDILSSVGFLKDKIDRQENPVTSKALDKLYKKFREFMRKFK